MDNVKTGNMIRQLRKEKRMTQLQLAERLQISDKTVSKWERGLGCPDVGMLPMLSNCLGINLETLLAGEMTVNASDGGNMKNTKFYVCPTCDNIVTSTSELDLSCCGKTVQPISPKKASVSEKLTVECIENDYFITSDHEMNKKHYIAFVALLAGDTLLMRKLYPEWNLETRIPRIGQHGMLIWYCIEHGLYYQLI